MLDRYYDARIEIVGEQNFLAQVAHTVGGKPISDEHLKLIVGSIGRNLNLCKSDHLLDLCCGNGLITTRLAGLVGSATGLDFSQGLVNVAQTHHQADNVSYGIADVARLDDWFTAQKDLKPFNKVLMFAAIQHFSPQQLGPLLQTLYKHCPEAHFLIGFVPNRGKRWVLISSARQRLMWCYRQLTGNDLFGTWWDPSKMLNAATGLGMKGKVVDIHPELDAARYRFDLLIGPPTAIETL